MSDSCPAKPVGPRITELAKSTLPAGLADEQGAFPFYCSSPQVRRIDRAMTSTSSILMGTGGVATVHLGRGAFSYSTDTWAFTVSDPCTDLAFLYRQLEHRLPQIDYAGFGGSGLRHLDKEYIRRLSLPVPSLKEQALIARMLSAIDLAIHETEALIVKLNAVKQGLLHDLLTRGIDANGELRPPQAEAPHLYKQSPLGWIPLGWDLVRLDDVAQRGSGHTPSKNVPSYWNGGIKWVSLADSHRLDNIYISETDKEISALGIANSSAVLHSAGTVILSRDAGVGKSAVLASDMAVSQHFMAWRCGDRLHNLFLYFYLQRQKPQFEAIALGSTIKTIGLPFFKSYQVAIPRRPEQELAASTLMEAEAGIAAHLADAAKLRELKAGLMDDLLTGRFRVTPLLAEAEREKECA